MALQIPGADYTAPSSLDLRDAAAATVDSRFEHWITQYCGVGFLGLLQRVGLRKQLSFRPWRTCVPQSNAQAMNQCGSGSAAAGAAFDGDGGRELGREEHVLLDMEFDGDVDDDDDRNNDDHGDGDGCGATGGSEALALAAAALAAVPRTNRSIAAILRPGTVVLTDDVVALSGLRLSSWDESVVSLCGRKHSPMIVACVDDALRGGFQIAAAAAAAAVAAAAGEVREVPDEPRNNSSGSNGVKYHHSGGAAAFRTFERKAKRNGSARSGALASERALKGQALWKSAFVFFSSLAQSRMPELGWKQ